MAIHRFRLPTLFGLLLMFGTFLPFQDAAGQEPAFVPDHVPPRIHPLPPLREQAKIEQEWAFKRVTEVIPMLMREYGVDMWILSMREYEEDPVFWAIKAPTTFAARRRSIYVFYDRGPGQELERLALGGGSQGGIFEAYRSTRPSPRGDQAELVGDEQWMLLRELVEDRDPGTIAVNIDEHWAFADGLGAGEWEALQRALGSSYVARVKREPRLAVEFIAHRLPEMMPAYREREETVHAILSQAFSSAVITPGVTTTEDVQWWLREEVQELGMTTWFHPSVDLQRAGETPSGGPLVIQRGDLLWTDFGTIAMNLHTDTQHLGYVFRPGETEVPAGLRQCLKASNRMQDILLAEMEVGRTGNEILAAALAQMEVEGIKGTIYTHPIGDNGHGSGPLIGRWDAQEGVPVRGEIPLRASTWHSIELQARHPVPEWDGKEVSCRQEEEAYVAEDGSRHWVFRRQTEFHYVW
ncbi:MAG: M24 family metallopeptidase [Gemmatimonadetes bacterium]|nr:M24 family metallopeptidase [Gemmatimonadota bacterium]